MNKVVSRLKFILSCAIFVIILCISYSRYRYMIGIGLAYLISLSVLLSPSFTLRKHNMKKENALTVDKVTKAILDKKYLLPSDGQFAILISHLDENHIILIDRVLDTAGKVTFMVGEAKYKNPSEIIDTLEEWGFSEHIQGTISELPNGDTEGCLLLIDSHLRPIITNILGGK